MLRRSHLSPRGVLVWLEAFFPLFASPEMPLYKARLLHFKGRFIDSPGAFEYYQMARPSDSDLLESESGLTKSLREYYGKKMESQLTDLSPDELAVARQRLRRATDELAGLMSMSCIRGKVAASYWLGVVSFEQGRYAPAIDYFANRVLQAAPGSSWTQAAPLPSGAARRRPFSRRR